MIFIHIQFYPLIFIRQKCLLKGNTDSRIRRLTDKQQPPLRFIIRLNLRQTSILLHSLRGFSGNQNSNFVFKTFFSYSYIIASHTLVPENSIYQQDFSAPFLCYYLSSHNLYRCVKMSGAFDLGMIVLTKLKCYEFHSFREFNSNLLSIIRRKIVRGVSALEKYFLGIQNYLNLSQICKCIHVISTKTANFF